LKYVDIDGYRLAYAEAGAGPPVLLVHGSLNDCRAWAQQMDAFAARYRTIAVSLRHCWPERWDGRGGDFTVEQHATDLAALLAALGLDAAHVIGHSRGGAVAIQLALAQPACVRSLVLADPGGLEPLLPDAPEADAMRVESARMFARLADDLARGDSGLAAQRFVDALGGEGAWQRRSTEQRQILLDNITTGPHCADRPAFSPARLAGLAIPMLLVTGARSPARYGIALAELARRNRSVRALVTIADAAHAMNRENAAAFNRAVMTFLDSIAA
jgi:pimeloyl-ACP methyl ester carboxylesterase